MTFLHPLFMVGFFYFLYCQRGLGISIRSLNEHSPEFSQRGAMLARHRTWGLWLVGWAVAGMIGGFAMTIGVMKLPLPLQHTYGHGFFGLLAVAALVAGLWLGMTVKKVVKPKIRERFLTFHGNMVYVVAIFGLLSLLSGGWVLLRGPDLS